MYTVASFMVVLFVTVFFVEIFNFNGYVNNRMCGVTLYKVYQKNGNRTLACYRAFNIKHTEIILA